MSEYQPADSNSEIDQNKIDAEESEEDVELYAVMGNTQGLSQEEIDAASHRYAESDEATPADGHNPYHKIEFLSDVPVTMQVEVGRTNIAVRNILSLKMGSVIEFPKVVGEPMEVTISGRVVARGEIVVVNERYGVRISEVTRADEEVSSVD